MVKTMSRAEPAHSDRTGAQRRADALFQLITGEGPERRGAVSLLVIADYDAVRRELKDLRLDDGLPMPAEELARLGASVEILPAFFDAEGQPLWLGRAARTASDAQRKLLAARDGGCIGCAAAPERCDAHHIEWWRLGGPTDIDNLCPAVPTMPPTRARTTLASPTARAAATACDRRPTAATELGRPRRGPRGRPRCRSGASERPQRRPRRGDPAAVALMDRVGYRGRPGDRLRLPREVAGLDPSDDHRAERPTRSGSTTPRETPATPFTDAECREKFDDLASAVYSAEASTDISEHTLSMGAPGSWKAQRG